MKLVEMTNLLPQILQFLVFFTIFANGMANNPLFLHRMDLSPLNCFEQFQNNPPSELPKIQNKPPFDPILARRLFHLAAGAYANSNPWVPIPVEMVIKRQKECIQKSNFPAIENWKHRGVHAEKCVGGSCSFFVVESNVKKQLIIAFRGTNTFSQLFWQMYNGLHQGRRFPNIRKTFKPRGLTDAINLLKIDTKCWGRIHKYFSHAFNQIWPDVRLRLKHFQDYDLIFTGHSLGGALASLAAAQTRVEGLRRSEQITLYTFGQPRIGNYEFAMAHSLQIPNSYRIVNREDGVVHMGPCQKSEPTKEFKNCFWNLFKWHLPLERRICVPNNDKFYHQGTEIWYNEEMEEEKRKLCTGIPPNEDINCSAGVPFNKNKMFQYIYDHQRYYGQWVSNFGMNGCKSENDLDGKNNLKIMEDQLIEKMHIPKEKILPEMNKIGKFIEMEEQKNGHPILDEGKDEEEEEEIGFIPGNEESESKSHENVKFMSILRDEQKEGNNKNSLLNWLNKLLFNI